ncbi:MAG TPA: hypothetical protein VJR48_07430 [Ktedonobacterales bacterium]|nr:hypothetical protein [Ktedonobacterales bacterium]
MHYQVVAKSDETAGAWDYYPYWAPVREKSAAERLASYAAQSGYEAAILQSVTPQMLEYVAIRVVERQDIDLLPSLRYLPGAPAARANGNGRQQRAVETAFRPSPVLDPYAESADKTELDARRLDAELGPGGDILQQRATTRRHPTLPLRMDIISAWLRLREKVTTGALGGAYDGLVGGESARDNEHTPSI